MLDLAIACPRHKETGFSEKSDAFFENAIIAAKALPSGVKIIACG